MMDGFGFNRWVRCVRGVIKDPLRILDTFFLRCQNNCHFNNVDCEKLQLTSFTTVSCVLFKAQARGYPRQGRWWMGNNVESPADKGPYQKS